MDRHDHGQQGLFAAGAAAALIATIYLTLLPFEFRDMTLAQGRAAFLDQSSSLPTGDARQQWVANVLMFLPLGFLWALWLGAGRSSAVRAAVVAAVSLLALAVTVSVEFVQAWIPGREPSLVDMSANLAGGFLGAIAGAACAGRDWAATVRASVERGRGGAWWVLSAYAVAYLFASLFPFDFPVTAAELTARFSGDQWGPWTAPGACSDGVRCAVGAALKPVLAAPVGIWLAMVVPAGGRRGVVGAVLAGVLCAVAIEFLQLLLYSGVAEGRSALLRSLGMAGGAALAGTVFGAELGRLLHRWRPVVAAAAMLLYGLALVTVVGGWGDYHWSVERALQELQSLHLLPFFYHYSVSEAVAMRSVVFQAVAYAPVGMLVWLATPGAGGVAHPGRHAAWWAAGIALMLALAVESLKLFAAGQRPDPTSLLIAAVAAAAACWILTVVLPLQPGRASGGGATPPGGGDTPPREPAEETAPPPPGGNPAWALRVAGGVLWAGVLAAAVLWPVWAPWIVVGLLIYGAVLYLRPAAAAFVVPAAVPLLDFSLLTGLEVVDEFDLLVAASIGSLLLVARRGRGVPGMPPAMAWLVALAALSFVISGAVGLREMSGFAQQGVTAYLSEYNILRQVKGFGLALVLFLVLPQSGHDVPALVRRYFVPGMVVGLVFLLAVIAWERAAYPGPFNFESTYRPSALFTDMQVGGPSIETALVLLLPFLLWWFWLRRSAVRLVAAVVLAAGGIHAVWVTYSRGGYLGLAVAAAVIAALAVIAVARGRSRWRMPTLAGIATVVVAVSVLAGAWIQSQDGFAGYRLARIEQDLDSRLEHWRDALALRKPGLVATVFGHGPGSFPQASFVTSPPDALPANFAFREAGGAGELVLGAGQSVYLNQRVPRVTGGIYELRVRGRSEAPATLRVFLCQKHVRHSFACVNRQIRFPGEGDEPATFRVELPTERLVQPETFPRRHHVLSMRLASGEGPLRLDSLQLRNDNGEALLRNADFAAGSTYWYFTTDALAPWRTENQVLEVLFDRGWFGVATFGLLVISAFLVAAGRSIREDFGYAAVAASMTGVLAVGMFSTVFFSPRLALLFYLVALLGVSDKRRRMATS